MRGHNLNFTKLTEFIPELSSLELCTNTKILAQTHTVRCGQHSFSNLCAMLFYLNIYVTLSFMCL